MYFIPLLDTCCFFILEHLRVIHEGIFLVDSASHMAVFLQLSVCLPAELPAHVMAREPNSYS